MSDDLSPAAIAARIRANADTFAEVARDKKAAVLLVALAVDLLAAPHTPAPAAVARATESAAVGGAGLEESA